MTYASETLFKLNQKNRIDKVCKMERRIVRTIINKKYQKEGEWRIIPNEMVYKEIQPITDSMKKRRISYFGHVMRMPADRLTRRIMEKLWGQKAPPVWMREVREDMAELSLTLVDLREKTEKLRGIKDENIRFKPRISKSGLVKRVFSEAERKARSDRMKRYWECKRSKNPKFKNKRPDKNKDDSSGPMRP